MIYKQQEEMKTAELIQEAIQLTAELSGNDRDAAFKTHRLTSNSVLLFLRMMKEALAKQGMTDDFIETTHEIINELLEKLELEEQDNE